MGCSLEQGYRDQVAGHKALSSGIFLGMQRIAVGCGMSMQNRKLCLSTSSWCGSWTLMCCFACFCGGARHWSITLQHPLCIGGREAERERERERERSVAGLRRVVDLLSSAPCTCCFAMRGGSSHWDSDSILHPGVAWLSFPGHGCANVGTLSSPGVGCQCPWLHEVNMYPTLTDWLHPHDPKSRNNEGGGGCQVALSCQPWKARG